MTDCPGSMNCTALKSEPSPPSIPLPPSSQASTSTSDHNHHGHPMKVLKGLESEKTKGGCCNSYIVEEHNDQRNGCLHVDTVSEISENTVTVHNDDNNPNMFKCANLDDNDQCLHITNSPISNSLSVMNNPKSCLDKVNGLKYTVAEHSTSDSSRLVNLLNNTNSSETTEEELQSDSDFSCNLVSSQGLGKELHIRQSDYVVSHNEVGNVNECSNEVPCGSELCDCLEALGTELGKTSLHEHSNSSDLLTAASTDASNKVSYVVYESEKQMPDIMRLITKDLSEPYSIYTYRYFIHNWPKLCILAMVRNTCVGAIVCKLDLHKKMVRRGYIAMLAVDSEHRRKQIGSTLVTKAIEAMMRDDCDEVVLETEITNEGALRLYENLGFVRDKRLFRYYLNGVDALRLKLWLR